MLGQFVTYNLTEGTLVIRLTLKWPRYFYSRWCPRGVPWKPPWENHFPTGILHWNLHHICTGHKKSQFCKKKKKLKCCTVSKWRPNNRFLFRVISILAKFWKNTIPKEFFNEICLKEGKYKQIYITEINFLKNCSVSKWWPKQFFDIAQ